MFAASATTEIFRCPGEVYDISRSVRLARLAAFYAKCRDCRHAPIGDGSAAAPDCDGEISTAPHRQASPFSPEGVRGRYLNELTRATAAEIAGAMASCLWDDFAGRIPTDCSRPGFTDETTPSDEHSTNEGIRILKPERPGPCVVVAHDERPSSPDIVTGVAQALRRMGCQVVDIGLATRPCLMFAIDHLQAAGGVQVTGAGCEPGWTGLDFVGRDGIACSRGGGLDRIAERFRTGYSRPSRRPGSQRTFQASIPYEAGLWKHFHALRPLKLALACSSHAVENVFSRAFRKLACRLIPIDTPTRARTPGDPTDLDFVRLAASIGEAQADLGVLIEEDGEQCTFLDERGQVVASRLLAKVFTDFARLDHRSASAIVYPAAWQHDQMAAVPIRSMAVDEIRSGQSLLFVCDPNREHLTRAMRRQQAVFGADGAGRFWFAESFPACDALLTVVHLLQALSQSDAPLSRLIQDLGR